MCTLPKMKGFYGYNAWRTENRACFRLKVRAISAGAKIEMASSAATQRSLKTAELLVPSSSNAASETGSGYQITEYPVVTLLVKLTDITFIFSVSAVYSGNDTCCNMALGLIFAL